MQNIMIGRPAVTGIVMLFYVILYLHSIFWHMIQYYIHHIHSLVQKHYSTVVAGKFAAFVYCLHSNTNGEWPICECKWTSDNNDIWCRLNTDRICGTLIDICKQELCMIFISKQYAYLHSAFVSYKYSLWNLVLIGDELKFWELWNYDLLPSKISIIM